VIDQVYGYSPSDLPAMQKDEFITNVCANFNIYPSIERTAQDIFSSSYTVYHKQFSHIEFAAYAIYTAMRRDSFPISGKEIIQMTNVPLQKIWAISKIINKSEYLNPESEIRFYISRYAPQCNLGFADITNICSQIADAHIICINRAPQNVAAGLIHNYSKKFTVQGIAKICNVTPSCLYQIVKILNEHMK